MIKKHTLPSATDLVYFIEVANLLNLSRASEALGISQPSLTLAMQRLECVVGEAIMTRHKRGITLTRAGNYLLAHAKSLVEQWEAIKTESIASVREVQGCIKIGCHVSLALNALPKFLPELIEKNPKLDIQLHHDLSRRITEQVINHKIDLGIAANPVRHPDLVISHLYCDKVRLWRANTLNKNTDVLSGDAVLICDPDLIQTKSILKKLKNAKITNARMLCSNNLEVIAKLTSKGCGIGVLPSCVAEPWKLVPVHRKIFYQDDISLLYRGENRNIKAIQVIATAIKEKLRKN